MEDTNSDSVYSLITSLCEQFTHNPYKIKRFRSMCYEILLGKKCYQLPKPFKDLKGTKDPFCNLLAWQFTLCFDYGLWDHSEKLKICGEQTKDLFKDEIDTFNSVLQFLLCLRNLPRNDSKTLDLSSLPTFDCNPNFDDLFRLPNLLLAESDFHFDCTTTNKFKLNKISEVKLDFNSKTSLVENCNNSNDKENIWEIVSKLEYSSRKTWENYGYSEPDKEKCFLSELGVLSQLWVENLESLYTSRKITHGNVFRLKLRSRKMFIKDLKFLLVGIPSDVFAFNDFGEFYLVPGVSIEGITPQTLNTYCRDFITSGSCYKALVKICTPNPENGKYRTSGYLFKELCDSIQRYLQFYRTAAVNSSESTNPFEFFAHTKPIRLQIITLAKICKVGPFLESKDIPNGVALLNYLYQELLSLTDHKIILVLYSILYSCCQVYISRFLTPWILDGCINDPFGEFFIEASPKYILTRGRTYWTRTFTLKQNIVPDFLINLREEILFCGKNMNLLKLCCPANKLCMYLMGKKPLILSCCITSDQLISLKHNTTRYYLEICKLLGSKFNLEHVIANNHKQDPVFMSLIAKKRAATLRRIELERQKRFQDDYEKRQEELNMLKEQYDAAIEMKQARIVSEIEREIKLAAEIMETEKIRETLIKEEANELISFYAKLNLMAEERRHRAEENIKLLKSTMLELKPRSPERSPSPHTKHDSEESLIKTDTSTESFYSVEDKHATTEDEDVVEDYKEVEDSSEDTTTLCEKPSTTSLDILNANTTDEEKINSNYKMAMENFEMARKIKHKILTEEMGFLGTDIVQKPKEFPKELTDAQKNKLRVMSSEFGIDVKYNTIDNILKTDRVLTAAQINKIRVLGTDTTFFGTLDNENFVNKNVEPKVKRSLSLNIKKDIVKVDKIIPMSVDSTPLSDCATTPSTMFLSIDTNQPTTAETQETDEGRSTGFAFDQESKRPLQYIKQFSSSNTPKARFSKLLSQSEAASVNINCLRLFLEESVSIPLITHSKLLNNELLRFFIEEIHCLDHLQSLRQYFFLQDGEFGRNITENFFHLLYNARNPGDVINCTTLQDLVFDALNISSMNQDNRNCLSFKINKRPEIFNLRDPDVLECVSLTYKVEWPLNILLPTDIIVKYDAVFKYLLKLNRVAWVLKKIFLELKVLAKETGKKEIYLMMSPQYRRLHQCRHVMLHFIQTLQNYFVGEVLHTSWSLFEKNLSTITSWDEIYQIHATYIKQIQYMCLQSQKSATVRDIIHKVFAVILKFYDYLRSRRWKCVNGAYVHPNFAKLNQIFENFEELVTYLFKKMECAAKVRCQTYLLQLIDMLNMNGYYSKK